MSSAAAQRDASIVAAPPQRGHDFLMFEDSEQLADFDFNQLEETIEGLDQQSRFLSALSFPKRLRATVLTTGPRCALGNRYNDVAHGLYLASSEYFDTRLQEWRRTRERQAYRQSLEFRYRMALAIMFLLFVWIGIGVQRAAISHVQSKSPTVYSMTSTARPVRARVAIAPEIKKDDAGRLLQVRAADPKSAVIGFCQNAPGVMCEPFELAWSDPRHADLRYGIFRSFHDLRAIEIVRDRRTRQWVVGDNQQPVNDFLAHTRRMSRERIPLDSP